MIGTVMNILITKRGALPLNQNLKQSFAPSQRRQPNRMPVIPLRSKRTLRPNGLSFKVQLQRHVDGVKEIKFNGIVCANLVAAAFLILTGISVVHISYANRQQVIELSELRTDRDELVQSWTSLLRDQNQLSEFSRIEATAIKSLSMHRPDKKDIYIMKQPSRS